MKRNNEARNWGVTILMLAVALVLICAFVFGFIKIFDTPNSKEQVEFTPQELYENGFVTGVDLAVFKQLILLAKLETRITDAEFVELGDLYVELSKSIIDAEEVTEEVSSEFNATLNQLYTDKVNVSQESLALVPTKIDTLGFMDGTTWGLYDEMIMLDFMLGYITEAEYEEYSQKADEYWQKLRENPSHEIAEEFFDYARKIIENLELLLPDEAKEPQFPSTIEGAQMGAFTLSKEFLE